VNPAESPKLWLQSGFKWYVERVVADVGGLAAYGWFAAPKIDVPHLAFAVNGQVFPHQDRRPRPDVYAATPALRRLPQYETVGMTAHGWNPPGAVRPGAWYRIELVDRRTGQPPAYAPRPFWHRLPAPTDPPVPGPDRMIRVGGHDQGDEFLKVGMQVFGALRTTLQAATKTDFRDYPRILDWGCGCGRLSRYFADLQVTVTGADVDADNVRWCSENLTFGRFETIPLHPPTPFADSSFDLAFGTSVLTHLTESVQFEWLAELKRVVRPGGILLLSFLGDAGVRFFRLSAEQIRRRDRVGILDLTKNKVLDGYLPEEDYYRDVFHTAEYVRREWGKYFEVVAHDPGALVVQDLVVLRRR
jgi:SAM-dependent methyltransferase